MKSIPRIDIAKIVKWGNLPPKIREIQRIRMIAGFILKLALAAKFKKWTSSWSNLYGSMLGVSKQICT